MKRFLAFWAALVIALGVAWGASYTVDPVGFLVDSDGRRVGFKRANGREDFFVTLNAAQTGLVLPDGTDFAVAGSGTVTATAGSLTSNAVVLGAGSVDSKVVAGITTNGTSSLQLGVAGTSVGSVAFRNATSGTVTLLPVTGALGTVSLSLPAATDTLVGRATTDTLTNKTLTSPVLNSPTLNTPTVATPTITDGTIDGQAIGFRHVPQISQSAAYTTVLTDCGKHIYHPTADTTARIFTVAANASVAAPVGCAITIVNDVSAGALTIAITSDTLLYADTGGTGSRTCATVCVATLLKITSTKWIISGPGVT